MSTGSPACTRAQASLLTLALSAALAPACALAKEDMDFVAEHLPEAMMDARLLSLPVDFPLTWPRTPICTPKCRRSLRACKQATTLFPDRASVSACVGSWPSTGTSSASPFSIASTSPADRNSVR